MIRKTRGCLAALITAGMLPAAAASAAGSFDARRAGTAHEALYCLDVEGTRAVAVGAPSLLFESKDGGRDWTRLENLPTDQALLGCALTAETGLIVGQGGVILRKVGDGAWGRVESGTANRLFGVAMNASGVAVAVGAFGVVLRSGDGGQTWGPLAIDWTPTNPDGLEPHLYGVHVADDGAMTVAGEFAIVMRSTDDGASWTQVHGGEASLFALDIGADDIGFAVGQQGTMLKTTDGGRTWATLPAATAANLFGVRRRQDGAVLVTGMRVLVGGRVDGATWTATTPGDVATTWYLGVAPGGPAGWLVAGHRGRIVEFQP